MGTDMFFFKKRFVLFLVFSLGFQLAVQAESVVDKECSEEAGKKNIKPEIKEKYLKDCRSRKTAKIQKAMVSVITCSNQLKKKYDIKESAVDSEKNKKSGKAEDEAPTGSISDLTIHGLKEDCQKEKQSAEECCSNPNSCNGMALDLAQHVAPLAPALFSAYKSYKISDDASKGELTHQETVNKLCNAQNTASLGAFGSGLLSQLSPLFQKTCGKQISKCKSACNNKVDEFKKDFVKCYSPLFPKEDIFAMIKSSKQCFDIDNDLLHEDFDFKKDSSGWWHIQEKESKCQFSLDKGFVPAPSADKDKYQKTALALLLYVAKAYKNTAKNKASLSTKSNEEEIIDCGHQPKRVLAPSSRPGAPVPPPAIQVCRQAVDYAVNNTPPPAMPGKTSTNQPGHVGPAGSLAGDTRGANLSSLGAPANEECQYGVVDSAKLEECETLDLGEEDFDLEKKPGLAKNPPSWQNGKGGGSSSGGGGGNMGGGVGSLAGDDSSKEGDGMYPYSGDMSENPNFSSHGGYGSEVYPNSQAGNPPHRQLAENLEDKGLDGMENPLLDEENPTGEKSIFQLASERIQNFCNDYFCDE